ncbi:MAG: 50S ribosomal protein L13 [Bdellovibrionales bacterium]|nr:50S ribosomal protein L13 [Bdellovibrionales bacterium]
MQKTWSAKPAEVKQEWKLVDAAGKSLGRLASETAKLLRGKHKPEFTPHVEGGDFVIIVNSEKVVLTGKKWTDKKYYRHSRYIGSLKERSAKDIKPEDLIRQAVSGMLPKNKLRPRMLKKLKVYKGTEHDHQAQNPKPYPIP